MKYTKRMLALVLAICMVFTSVQLPVNAEEGSAIETVAEDLTVEASADEEAVTEESEVDDSATESVEEIEAEDSMEVDAIEDATDDLEEDDETDSDDVVVEEASEEDSAVEELVVEESTTEKEVKDVSVKEESVSHAAVNAVESDKEVVDAAIIFTDAHTQSSNYKESEFNAIFGLLKDTGLPFSSVTSGGDAFSVNEDSGKYTGKTATLTGYIRTALGDDDIPVNYVWSDHDRYAVQEDGSTLLDKTSRVVYGDGEDGILGTDDDGKYYVYALSHGDLSTNDRYGAGFVSNRVSNGFTESIEKSIDNFEADAEKMYKDRPLFIVSHQPLFANRGDNGHAAAWCEAINAVADKMDVAFFFGHNHKYDTANDYYYAKGSQMPVAQANNDKTGTKTEIKFTHMCAGYMSPKSSTSYSETTTRQNVAVAVAIYEDSIQYKTYGAGSEYDADKYPLDVTVKRDHADGENLGESDDVDTPEIPDLEGYELARVEVVNQGNTKYFVGDTFDATGLSVVAVYKKDGVADARVTLNAKTDEADGYVVSGYDLSRVGKQYVTVAYKNCVGSFAIEVYHRSFTSENGDVTIEFASHGVTSVDITSEVKEVEGYKAYVTYDITPVGYVQGDEASVTVTVDTEVFDVNLPVSVLDQGECIATTDIVDGKISFVTNHFSEYDVMQVDESALDWVHISTQEGETTYELASTIESGETYLIASGNNGSIRLIDFDGGNGTLVGASNGEISSNISDSSQWIITQNGSGYIIQNLDTNKYLYPQANYTSSSFPWGGGGRWQYSMVPDGNSATVVSISTGSNSTFKISRSVTSSNKTTNSSISYSRNSFSASNSGTNLYLFKKVVQTGGSVYAAMAGTTSHSLALSNFSDPAAIENAIRQELVVYSATDSTGTGMENVGSNYTLEWNQSFAGTGEYTITVKYEGVSIGNVSVAVVDKVAQSISVNPTTYTVERDTSTNENIGTITVVYDDGQTENVNLTLGMLSGNLDVAKNGTYTDLSITYAGKTVTGLTLKVVNKSGMDDFPAYPNPGSIDLKKTATGIDFQNTGVARVELSASGLPAGGVDVAVIVDTGSSMKGARLDAAKTAINNMLTQFMDAYTIYGSDIDVAVVGFNGFNGTDFAYITGASLTNAGRTTSDSALAYTSSTGPDKKDVYDANSNFQLTETTFMNASKLTSSNISTLVGYISAGSGTNYDGGLASAYRLLAAKKAVNKTPRQQFVVFLSDGAGFLYNGFMAPNDSSNGGREQFNRWLQGEWADVDALKDAIKNDEFPNGNKTNLLKFAEFYNGNGTTHPNRIAEAIKGSPSEKYTIVRSGAGSKNNYQEQWDGLGATIYSIGLEMADDTSNNAGDGKVTVGTLHEVINAISSGEGYGYPDATNEQLKSVFEKIAKEINVAAANARFVDQMGSNFNLQMDPSIRTNAVGSNGGTTTNTDIVITTHNIYTESQIGKTVEGHLVVAEDVGKAYGTGTTLETVKFAVSGETIKATTSATGYALPNGTTVTNTTNILVGDVLYGKYFYYNNSTTAKSITLANGSSINLPAETFYWNIGTINEVKYTLSYTVYLDGALDGHSPASDSYSTNNFATLYYTNHVGNEVSQSVTSPTIAWKGAQISYAFYLVNSEGKPVYADGKEAPNFSQAYKLTQPVVYKSVELNATATTLFADAVAVLPEGYSLYAAGSRYTVQIGSGDGSGANQSGWKIENDSSETTYVVGYSKEDPNAYSNKQEVTNLTYDYTHTTVYFAVKWTIGTVPDTVVIDHGLDVEVNVLSNDMFGTAGTLVGVGASSSKPNERGSSLADGFGGSVTDSVGTATIKNGKVRYSLNKENSMKLKDARTLAYAVDYKGETNPGYYYGDLTIIPATTVYYEDEYLKLTTYNKNNTDTNGNPVPVNGWPKDSKAVTEIQAEDRPGYFNLGTIDANNIYGFDSAYENMSTYSMDNAAMIHVDDKQYGTAEFDFYGTGFDVISTTSNDTGTFVVQVYNIDENGNCATTPMKSMAVDSYYGYVYGLFNVVYQKGADGVWTKVSVGDPVEEGTIEQTKADLPSNAAVGATSTIVQRTWKAVKNDPNALYQVPVMSVEGLTYGQYRAKITAVYYSTFDSTVDPGYDLYLDAIRIYNPAGTTDAELGTVIKEAYEADGEYDASYYELRNQLIKASTIKNLSNNAAAQGIVFIDGNRALSDGNAINESAVIDYQNYGPNNELYLAKGQAVAFDFYAPAKDGYNRVVRIGLKNVGEKSATAELWNVVGNNNKANVVSQKLETTTDMFYDISVLNGGTVVITNNGDDESILSITNVKISYKLKVENTPTQATKLRSRNVDAPVVFSVSKATVETALKSLEKAKVEQAEVVSVATDKPSYIVADTIAATVETNTATAYVIVNGQEITEFTEEENTRIWTFDTRAEEKLELKVVAYNKLNEASEGLLKSIDVKKFAPETFKIALNKKTILVGEKVKATVTTSTDVKYVTINGTKVTKYTSNNANGTKTWSLEVKATKTGTMIFKAVAYNVNDGGSNEITATVAAKRFAPKTFKIALNKKTVLVGEKVKATVTTSTDVKYVTINGKKITKYASDKAKGIRTWSLEVKATKTGKMAFKAVAYNTNGNASNEITAAATAKKFTPAIFKIALNKKTVLVGEKIKAKVTTSTGVKYVTINGKKITKYTSDKEKGTRTWILEVKATKTGKMTFKAVAYNKNGSGSNEITATATAKRFVPEKFNVTLNKSTVQKGKKYTVSVTTSTDVKYVKVNGNKITKYSLNKAKNLKTFEVTYKAEKVGETTVKVIAYNKNGAASNSKTQTVTVKK